MTLTIEAANRGCYEGNDHDLTIHISVGQSTSDDRLKPLGLVNTRTDRSIVNLVLWLLATGFFPCWVLFDIVVFGDLAL